jgi:hypothetical protein
VTARTEARRTSETRETSRTAGAKVRRATEARMRKSTEARRRTGEARRRTSEPGRRAGGRRGEERERGIWRDCCDADYCTRGQDKEALSEYRVPGQSGTVLFH